MNTPAPVYLKVRGRGFSWKGHGSLWLAEDHLLEATSVIVLESYRRFFFREIRAFVVQRTSLRTVWGWLFGGGGIAFGVIAGLASWIGIANAKEDWHVAFFVPAVLFGAAAAILLSLCVINLSLGPSCCCHVLTSTGWHTLTAPKRMSKAMSVQAQVSSLIQATQDEGATADAT
jgi:hypothetical protein